MIKYKWIWIGLIIAILVGIMVYGTKVQMCTVHLSKYCTVH